MLLSFRDSAVMVFSCREIQTLAVMSLHLAGQARLSRFIILNCHAWCASGVKQLISVLLLPQNPTPREFGSRLMLVRTRRKNTPAVMASMADKINNVRIDNCHQRRDFLEFDSIALLVIMNSPVVVIPNPY